MTVRAKGNKFMADFMVAGTRYREVFDSRVEAEAWEHQTRGNLKLGKPVERKKAAPAISGGGLDTTGGLLKHVYDVHWAALSSGADQQRNAKRFVDFVGANVPPSSAFTVEELGRFVNHLRRVRCSNATINRHLSTVSKMARVATRARRLPHMPEIPWQKESGGRTRTFTPEEVEAVVNTARTWGYEAEAGIFRFLIDTGCRLGELQKVRWKDFSEDLTRVTFFGDITKNDSDRTIPLFPSSTAVLKQRRLTTGHMSGPFRDVTGPRLRKVWYRIRDRLRLGDDAKIHTFRHTRATWFAAQGQDFFRIQKWMGHRSLSTTRLYTHLVTNDLDTMVNPLTQKGQGDGDKWR